ncbi:MAG: SdiA-regulated domain-containing protein [Bacteroidota bacterium]
MSLVNRPNFLSLLILGGVVAIAGSYGLVTYTQGPEMEHFDVDPNYHFPFNFDEADEVAELPKQLTEISGLTFWKSPNEVLCVQDEDGKLFVVNTVTGKIKESFKFGKDRDYEGVARVGNDIYVLEADGDVHHTVYQPGQEEYEATKMETAFSYRNDTEGICYDSLTNQLLIVPKEKELTPEEEDLHHHGIYAFDRKTGTMQARPVLFIDEKTVGKAVNGRKSRYSFKPSGVAVDPITQDVFVLASVGKVLVVIGRDNKLKHVELLKEKVFRQPEGITFSPSGDLYLSSEGRGEKGIVVTFKRQGQAQIETRNE